MDIASASHLLADFYRQTVQKNTLIRLRLHREPLLAVGLFHLYTPGKPCQLDDYIQQYQARFCLLFFEVCYDLHDNRWCAPGSLRTRFKQYLRRLDSSSNHGGPTLQDPAGGGTSAPGICTLLQQMLDRTEFPLNSYHALLCDFAWILNNREVFMRSMTFLSGLQWNIRAEDLHAYVSDAPGDPLDLSSYFYSRIELHPQQVELVPIEEDADEIVVMVASSLLYPMMRVDSAHYAQFPSEIRLLYVTIKYAVVSFLRRWMELYSVFPTIEPSPSLLTQFYAILWKNVYMPVDAIDVSIMENELSAALQEWETWARVLQRDFQLPFRSESAASTIAHKTDIHAAAKRPRGSYKKKPQVPGAPPAPRGRPRGRGKGRGASHAARDSPLAVPEPDRAVKIDILMQLPRKLSNAVETEYIRIYERLNPAVGSGMAQGSAASSMLQDYLMLLPGRDRWGDGMQMMRLCGRPPGSLPMSAMKDAPYCEVLLYTMMLACNHLATFTYASMISPELMATFLRIGNGNLMPEILGMRNAETGRWSAVLLRDPAQEHKQPSSMWPYSLSQTLQLPVPTSEFGALDDHQFSFADVDPSPSSASFPPIPTPEPETLQD